MTTRESKGRFFLLNESIRIDSHNESNRIELRIGMLYSPEHSSKCGQCHVCLDGMVLLLIMIIIKNKNKISTVARKNTVNDC